MHKALEEAKKAAEQGEVPVGCVIVCDGEVIAAAHNLRETTQNAIAHAELLAIDAACKELKSWRLPECELYVTLEPCPMCAGAIIQARIPEVIFGAKNPKAGCAGSILDILNEPRFNHQVRVTQGICETECAGLMTEFFKRFRGL
jgi:tRNA(adenine34) deaminase